MVDFLFSNTTNHNCIALELTKLSIRSYDATTLNHYLKPMDPVDVPMQSIKTKKNIINVSCTKLNFKYLH